MPLPLMVETNWTMEGWEVNIVLVTDVVSNGYSSVDVWTHTEPYRNDSPDTDQAAEITATAVTEFGHRLRALLATCG